MKTLLSDLLKEERRFFYSYWRWGLRFALLWLVLMQLAAPRPRVILDSPQQVQAVNPVCVHTRLIDEVEEWVIQRSLQLVREMGADTIVEFFPWAYIESQQGVYDWRQADRIMRHAENQGIKVIARMGLVPAWARPEENSTFNYLPDESFDDFGRFVATFAERYLGRVEQIIIWNEPNLAFEWGYRPVNPENYVRLLQTVYPLAKAANPNVMILAGALAPTIEPVGSPNGLQDTLYLEGMYEAGAANYFDALAIHTYGLAMLAEAEPAPNLLNFRRAELLFDIMKRYSDGDKPVYITESGWNDNPRWVLAVRPSQRVQYTVDALRYTQTNWPQVQRLCIWAFRYPLPTLSYPDNFTLVTTDFEIKPIYDAIRAYAQGEEGTGRLWLPPPSEN
jgi:polysaccharide biosynthesis protein PslG